MIYSVQYKPWTREYYIEYYSYSDKEYAIKMARHAGKMYAADSRVVEINGNLQATIWDSRKDK